MKDLITEARGVKSVTEQAAVADIRNAVAARETGVCGICGRRHPMSELKLLPCPFCGGEARLRYLKPLGWVQCKKCGATSAAVSDYYEETDGKGQAVAAWNRRAQPENERLTLGELRQMEGEPVWVQELPPYTTAGYKVLAAPAVDKYGDICFDDGDYYAPDDYGKAWLAYRAKPERSEGE